MAQGAVLQTGSALIRTPGFPSAGPAAARRGVGEEWHKPNAMPEPVTDQLATRYEHLFLLTRSPRYWFDLREPATRPGRLLGAAWPRA